MFRLLLAVTLWHFMFEAHIVAGERIVNGRISKKVKENVRDLTLKTRYYRDESKTADHGTISNYKQEALGTVRNVRSPFFGRIRKHERDQRYAMKFPGQSNRYTTGEDIVSRAVSSSRCSAEQFECPEGFRQCIPGNWECDGHGDCFRDHDEENCENGNGWSDWTKWGECNVLCGTGEHSRTRHCLNSDGEGCNGEGVEYKLCHLKPCYEEAVTGCGTRANPAQPRIVGGEDALPGEWPWQAQFYFIPLDTHLCGGTLIGPKHVISAAHCFCLVPEGNNTENWKLRLGKYRLSNEPGTDGKPMEFKIARIVLYPDYYPYVSNGDDIAIVELEQEVTPSDFINYACLNTKGVVFDDHSYCFTTGWGAVHEPNITAETQEEGVEQMQKFYPEVLQEALVPLIPIDICNASYGFLKTNMICAGYLGGGTGTCSGDSGGPLVCLHQNSDDRLGHWYLVGVVNFGGGCARKKYPTVFSKVDNYLDWIRDEGGIP
ncbi:prostasin-like [Glandiceps talaboti]